MIYLPQKKVVSTEKNVCKKLFKMHRNFLADERMDW